VKGNAFGGDGAFCVGGTELPQVCDGQCHRGS